MHLSGSNQRPNTLFLQEVGNRFKVCLWLFPEWHMTTLQKLLSRHQARRDVNLKRVNANILRFIVLATENKGGHLDVLELVNNGPSPKSPCDIEL